MILRRQRPEHITFTLIRQLFQCEDTDGDGGKPLSARAFNITLAVAGCALVLYSLCFGVFSR